MRSRHLGTKARTGARAAALLALGVTLLGSAATARAQGPSPADTAADAAFEQGRTLLAQQRLVEACAKLEESDRLRPSGRAALNLADCFERRGMIASAHARFLDAAQRAVEAHRVDAEQHARSRASRLEARLPRVVIVVPAGEDGPDLQITHQGSPLPRAAWNVPATVDPGMPQTYEATAHGKTFRATVTPEEGKTQRVEVHFRDEAQASPVPAVVPATTSAHAPLAGDPGARPSRLPAYVALGAGAVGIGLGAFAGLQVLSAKSSVDEHCATDRSCDADGMAAADRGKTYSVLAPIGFGVGAVGIGLGTYLLLRNGGRSESPRAASSFVLTPTAGQSGGGFVASGAF